VTRLRLRFRYYLVPLLLAAVGMRALVPPGFMPGTDDDLNFKSTMCSTLKDKSEIIELPGEERRPHCEHCLAPLLGAPLAFLRFDALAPTPLRIVASGASQIAEAPLARAQIPRAPPHA
jgi:hypothetical protein